MMHWKKIIVVAANEAFLETIVKGILIGGRLVHRRLSSSSDSSAMANSERSNSFFFFNSINT